MTGFGPLAKSLVAVEGLACTTLVIRFLFSGLYHAYRFFFLYLIAYCVQLAGPFFLKMGTQAYATFFFSTEGLIVFLYVLVALELYSLILRDLKGIATVARRFIHAAIAISILFSVLLLGLESTPRDVPDSYRNVALFFSFEQPIVSSLIFFVFLITAFLFYYPIPLNRNVIHYTIGYALYFSSKAVLLFLNSIRHGEYRNGRMSLMMLAVSAGCLLFWLFALTREGEIKPRSSGGSWTKDKEDAV
ncbi:MAG: hypothetical protein M3Z32_05385, partial [Acidobacteriota bacterium]|nr:hypothetical protein [Acidobacteriota bacterium]